MAKIMVGLYWAARVETLEEAAARLQRHFHVLASTSDHLADWYPLASRKPKNPTAVDTASLTVLTDLLEQGVNRRDEDKTVMTELGWRVALWTRSSGRVEGSTSVLCNCTSPRLTNSALVGLEADDTDPLSGEQAETLMKRLIDIWMPDEGVVKRSVWDPAAQRREETTLANWEAH